MQELVWFGQIVLAAILGGLVGLQRERWGKSAGPRTYALVSGGAALFTILSLHAFGDYSATVASSIVSGIGFLGAGLIFKSENHVEGLTTAAGLWTISAIGMAVGIGYYVLSVLGTLLMLALLALNDRRFRKHPEEAE